MRCEDFSVYTDLCFKGLYEPTLSMCEGEGSYI